MNDLTATHLRGSLTADAIAALPDARTVGGQPPQPPTEVGTADVPLPAPAEGPRDEADRITLLDALARRRTRRQAPPEPLPLERLSWLLHHAARTDAQGRRPHPSAGAAYPLVIDLVALRCTALAAGVHRYLPDAHGLRTTREGSFAAEVVTALGRSWAGEARALLVIGGDLATTDDAHGFRGYRYALQEAGHLAQSLLLLAVAAELPACPVGGFADEPLATLVGHHGDEVPLTTVVL